MTDVSLAATGVAAAGVAGLFPRKARRRPLHASPTLIRGVVAWPVSEKARIIADSSCSCPAPQSVPCRHPGDGGACPTTAATSSRRRSASISAGERRRAPEVGACLGMLETLSSVAHAGGAGPSLAEPVHGGWNRQFPPWCPLRRSRRDEDASVPGPLDRLGQPTHRRHLMVVNSRFLVFRGWSRGTWRPRRWPWRRGGSRTTAIRRNGAGSASPRRSTDRRGELRARRLARGRRQGVSAAAWTAC